MGNALYRLDRDGEALDAWERVTAMGETPATYRAWRQVAAARVRAKDLEGALDAYRQCERRAPAADKGLIASRLGWLSKETGNSRAAGRYFARSRGDALPAFMTYLMIAVTVVTSLIAMQGVQNIAGVTVRGGPLEDQLALNKIFVAHGEIYRLLSVVLVHDPNDILHLLFNMYALWYAGQLVERMYGAGLLLFFYVLAGIGASIASYIFGDSVGVLNLVLGFSGVFGNVDNFAHIGGLVAGAWLALVMPPGRVPTLSSLWQAPGGGGGSQLERLALPVLGVAALIAVLIAGYFVGTARWQADPLYRFYGSTTPHVVRVVPAPQPLDFELT